MIYTNKFKSWQLAALASPSLNFSRPNLFKIGGGLKKQAEALFKSAAPAVRLGQPLNLFVYDN